MILAIDPGNERSGYCFYDGERVVESGKLPNPELAPIVRANGYDVLAIEAIASYGMPVGREVFETCIWTGRFMEQSGYPHAVRLVYRRDVKMHLCGSARAKDSNIRQSLLDMFPPVGGGKTPQIGTKAKPGPLFGVSGDAWSALAVAVTVQAALR